MKRTGGATRQKVVRGEEMSTPRMSDLRIYVSTEGADALDHHGVFYSQRDEGPFYRWHFDESSGRWHGSRVSPRSVPKSIRMVPKSVPDELRKELVGHYPD